eukprot:CCRYP_017659-RA/>CCRYP_017659-RA protein AED:0.48 eAED:1.00 QI:0/0/0/1/0/0/2/0/78
MLVCFYVLEMCWATYLNDCKGYTLRVHSPYLDGLFDGSWSQLKVFMTWQQGFDVMMHRFFSLAPLSNLDEGMFSSYDH